MALEAMRGSWLWHAQPSFSAWRLVQSRLRSRATMELGLSDIRLVAPPGSALRCYSYCGEMSANVAAVTRVCMRDGGLFLDGGAFAGQHSQHAIQASDGAARVVAFEPDDRARRLLGTNLRAAGIEDHVDVRSEALSDRVGTLRFVQASKLSESAVATGEVSQECKGVVRSALAVNFGHIVSQLNPSLVKLDLEGHEHIALGALLDFEARPVIIAEANEGAEEAGRRLGYEIVGTDDLFPHFSKLTNLSADILLVRPGMLSVEFRREVNRTLASLLRRPQIMWRPSNANYPPKVL